MVKDEAASINHQDRPFRRNSIIYEKYCDKLQRLQGSKVSNITQRLVIKQDRIKTILVGTSKL